MDINLEKQKNATQLAGKLLANVPLLAIFPGNPMDAIAGRSDGNIQITNGDEQLVIQPGSDFTTGSAYIVTIWAFCWQSARRSPGTSGVWKGRILRHA